MILTILGSSPGEAAVILFSDGTIITIDCCKRKENNYSIKYLIDNGLDPDSVQYNVITHFHDDHIRGVSELVAYCKNARIVVPDVWSSDIFKHFAVLFDPKVNLGERVVIRELLKLFDQIGKNKRKVLLVSELTQLYPPAGVHPKVSAEHLMVLSPTAKKKTKFLTRLAAALGKSEAEARKCGIEDANDTSLSFLLRHNDNLIFLGGDLQNLAPDFDIDNIHLNQNLPNDPYSFVKMPHHGSRTSFSNELRNRVSNADTTVVITPYPRSKKKLPNAQTAAHLKGVANIIVLKGEQIGLDRADRMLDISGITPVREYRPGTVEYCDGSIDAISCVSLDAYLASPH